MTEEELSPWRRIELRFDYRRARWRLTVESRASGPEDPVPAVDDMLMRLASWSAQFEEDPDDG